MNVLALPGLREAFLKAGPEAVDIPEINPTAYPRHPDYRSELEDAAMVLFPPLVTVPAKWFGG